MHETKGPNHRLSHTIAAGIRWNQSRGFVQQILAGGESVFISPVGGIPQFGSRCTGKTQLPRRRLRRDSFSRQEVRHRVRLLASVRAYDAPVLYCCILIR